MVRSDKSVVFGAAKFFSLLVIAVFFTVSVPAGAGGKSPEQKAVDPFKQNKLLGRGTNIPGVLDRSGSEVPDEPMKKEYFKLIKDAGFQNVRIPIRFSSYSQEDPPYKIDPSFMKKVDWMVEQSLANGFAVVIDFHYYPLISFTGRTVIKEDPKKNRERFLALWTQISDHFKKAPGEVMFGLLNEPSHDNLGIDGWNQLVKDTIPIMRRTNPNRTILVATANGGVFSTIESLEIPVGENNVIVEVHNYEPMRFTHQQASWTSYSIYKDIEWNATFEERQAVIDDFGKVASWAKQNNRPLYLGEFGAYEKADMPSRARWTRFIVDTAEKNNMSWAYWGFWRCGFDVFDEKSETWTKPLLDALIQPE